MNSHQHKLSAAEDQAALWAARLEGSALSAADRAALDAWLAEDASHRALLSSYCQFSADLEVQLPALVASGAVKMPAKPAAARSTWGWGWLTGGALAAAAVVACVVWVGSNRTHPENFAAPAGQLQHYTLADGTQVELNAGTRLLVENGRAERRVRLLEGEAFFTVSKDPARPFIVETPAGSVRVTGTIFNVHCETKSALEVIVTEGSVQVRPATGGNAGAVEPFALKAGDQLTANASGVSVQKLSASGLDEALAWRQGQIVCREMPLREALARFSRYHGRSFTASTAAGDLKIGGRYSLDDPDFFFSSLRPMFPRLRLTRDLNGNVQVNLDER